MKCQTYFLGKQEKLVSLLSAELAQNVVEVKLTSGFPNK